MKKIRIALLASLACLFAVSCDKEEADTQLYSATRFKVETPQFIDENGSKVYLHYTDMASSLIYEEGDQVYINGHAFSLRKREAGWFAESNDGTPVVGKRFLVTYADGSVSSFDSTNGTYQYNLNTTLSSSAHNKIVLGGVAENHGDYVIKLQPACAILRLNTGGRGSNFSEVKVGFDGNKIPRQGTINVTNRTLAAGSNSNYMTGVDQDGNGEFLKMRYSDPSSTGEGDYWYVAIPIEGNDVTTTLYLSWDYGGSTVQQKTQGRVTLRKGYVYTIGTKRQSPFSTTGVSKCSFNVNAGGSQVQFSAGNLQSKRTRDGAWTFHFQFAPHQYDAIGSTNSSAIENNNQWFDLFGYGTSGYDAHQTARLPNSTSTTLSDYIDAAIYNTYSDWGKYVNYYYPSYKIFYGNTDAHSENWRTLKSEEWTYLINRSDKAGLATVSGIKGIILLPDSDEEGNDWVNNEYIPDGISFTATFSNYLTNNYSATEWDKFEMAGAIFLPVTGYRSGTVITNSENGYYWSASAPSLDRGHPVPALVVTSSSAAMVNTNRSWGCAVRLVVDVQELK